MQEVATKIERRLSEAIAPGSPNRITASDLRGWAIEHLGEYAEEVDRFIDLRDVRNTLQLHPYKGEPYYLGAFLLGAYQEILGDLHNLFGDTNAVHVSLDDNGAVNVDQVIKGDTVREVLDYVQFKSDALVTSLRRDVELALREGRIGYEESGRLLRFYEEGLHGYTYLETV